MKTNPHLSKKIGGDFCEVIITVMNNRILKTMINDLSNLNFY